MDQVVAYGNRAVAMLNERCEGMTPAAVVWRTMLAMYVAGKLAEVLRAPGDTLEAVKVTVFHYLRRHFGGLLGYDKAMAEATASFVTDFAKGERDLVTLHDTLPVNGNSMPDVIKLCKELATLNGDYSKGQYSGSIYHGGMEGYTEFINEAMGIHQWTNPLHGTQFHGVRKMEVEVISMCLNMFNARGEECGAITTGGTESILLAMKAYREFAKATRGVTKPELVVPVTAHAAFDKAAHYFGIKIRHARMDPVTCKVDLKHMKSLITWNTIALVGSAPHYPHGVIDPIEEIAAMGKARNIPVHVDACLGGFVIAFMEKAGIEIDEKFDFRVDGVTSISCDTHKYGFAPKGSSTILYKNTTLRMYQMHSQPNWPGGIYASPTISGSRIGNVVAGTWAAMMHHGLSGYVQSAKRIVETARYIKTELEKIPGIKIMGDPKLCVVGFTSTDFDVYRLLEATGHLGWELNSLQFPPAVHICVTNVHAVNNMEHGKRFVADIAKIAASLMLTKHEKSTGAAALYGTSQSIPDRAIIGDISKAYFDTYYDAHVQAKYKKLQESA